MFKRLRAAWRALFSPEPPLRLDGYVIQFRTLMSGKPFTWEEWQRQATIRGKENLQREIAWMRGERM